MSEVYEEVVALFLFAHQDDEFGVFQKITDELNQGHRVCCAYLTDGSVDGGLTLRRNSESIAVLKKLGVNEQDIVFAGEALGISDTQLHAHLMAASDWICKWISGFSNISLICIPAWEGGHHDHDALHAVAVTITGELELLDCVRQFPLYHGYRCVGPFFKILSPLPMNGRVVEVIIPWRNRSRFLRYCLSYPSQAITWMGLFPFAVLHYLLRGVQSLQPVSSVRITQRPHNGTLYYETRAFFTWEKMVGCLSLWRSSRGK
ncbi:PIG-L deacetylase family protein [Mariprofundus ferrooxydans]|uniref:PIG-L deacetylase family protein n=1 Tax=Mariprofundus ferrooxydans TaxID=314344 RepID=UPI000365D9FB|nr:PIG-L family deacetylase [Mariprofundus ferrooxydans]